MTEAIEVSVARIQETLKAISAQMQRQELQSTNDETSRKQLHIDVHSIDNRLVSMDARLQQVEQKLTAQSPTIDQFVAMRNQVAGAGWLGRVLWALAAFSIGAAASAVTILKHWK